MKYRALIVGAGRIGAGFLWHDDAYTHAGAYHALADRVQLCGFVEPDLERANAAKDKWGWLDNYDSLDAALENSDPFDIISVCTQPETQPLIYERLGRCVTMPKVLWCEKPYWGPRGFQIPTQVNFMRRADPKHREISKHGVSVLQVTGKLDHHTVPHFEDLARFWGAKRIDYTISLGPCSYRAYWHDGDFTAFEDFPNGGVDGGKCFKGMLENILDFLDNGTPLFSPAP